MLPRKLTRVASTLADVHELADQVGHALGDPFTDDVNGQRQNDLDGPVDQHGHELVRR